MYNNDDIAKLNDLNLGIARGYSESQDGKTLDDILPEGGVVGYRRGIREGVEHYLDRAVSLGLRGDPEYLKAEDSLKGCFGVLGVGVSHKRLVAEAYLRGNRGRVSDDVVNADIEYWLNRLLAEEFNAWYQYFTIVPFLVGDERPHVQEAFKEYAKDELDDHAVQLINRLHDLGYEVDWLSSDPVLVQQYVGAPYVYPTTDVTGALQVMLQSEKNAIDSYTQACNFAESQGDRVSLDIFKAILADEQDHFASLQHFIKDKSV